MTKHILFIRSKQSLSAIRAPANGFELECLEYSRLGTAACFQIPPADIDFSAENLCNLSENDILRTQKDYFEGLLGSSSILSPAATIHFSALAFIRGPSPKRRPKLWALTGGTCLTTPRKLGAKMYSCSGRRDTCLQSCLIVKVDSASLLSCFLLSCFTVKVDVTLFFAYLLSAAFYVEVGMFCCYPKGI
jgi:hypothetical protein